MELKAVDSPVIEKTKELCQTLLEQPYFHEIRGRIDAFATNEPLRLQYEELCDLQERLQSKESDGLPLSDEEIDEFDQARDALFRHETARGFADAQKELHKLQQTVAHYITKTFKLGRLPEADDFESGTCGPNCGCGGKE